jgi:hypothetical protein
VGSGVGELSNKFSDFSGSGESVPTVPTIGFKSSLGKDSDCRKLVPTVFLQFPTVVSFTVETVGEDGSEL